MPKILALLTARMGSSRLPGKTLLPILGRPMLARMIERVRYSRHVERVVVATTTRGEDDPIQSLAEELDVGCFRGSASDVLGRLNAALQAEKCQTAIQLLGDNPFVHSELIDDVVDYYLDGSFDYVVTATKELPDTEQPARRFALGIRVEVFAPVTLVRSAQLARQPHYREHATSFIYHHPEIFKLGYFEAKGRWRFLGCKDQSLAVNYQSDYEKARKVFERLYPANPNFPLSDVITFLEKNEKPAETTLR